MNSSELSNIDYKIVKEDKFLSVFYSILKISSWKPVRQIRSGFKWNQSSKSSLVIEFIDYYSPEE